jgi:hypothetical protein
VGEEFGVNVNLSERHAQTFGLDGLRTKFAPHSFLPPGIVRRTAVKTVRQWPFVVSSSRPWAWVERNGWGGVCSGRVRKNTTSPPPPPLAPPPLTYPPTHPHGSSFAKPLALACENSHLEVVKVLLQNGADVNKEDPLGYACENGCLEVCLRNRLCTTFKLFAPAQTPTLPLSTRNHCKLVSHQPLPA